MKRLVAILTIIGALIAAAIAWGDHPIEFGQTTQPPSVSCPANCQAVGQVTGFEVQQGTSKNPFTRRRRGKVVAFSVTLGKPKASDITFFNKLFGSPPQAQLAVLKPGYVVALTVPTWAPAFAVNLGNDEAWRSSRDPQHCDDVQQKAAQVTRGQLASYQCLYRTARLMYTATFIPDPRVTTPTQTTPKKKTGSG